VGRVALQWWYMHGLDVWVPHGSSLFETHALISVRHKAGGATEPHHELRLAEQPSFTLYEITGQLRHDTSYAAAKDLICLL